MSTQNIFYPTGFSLAELTAAINLMPHVPSQLGDLGLFQYDGVSTLTVQIERSGTTLDLVGSAPRGSGGESIGRDSRDLRPFNLVHLAMTDSMLADEVQGVRAFGSENGPTPVQQRLAEILLRGNRRINKTMEWQRVGALNGIILDKDGTTPLLNLHTEFGTTQTTQDFKLDDTTTSVRVECDKAIDTLEDKLEGQNFETPVALCGRDYWKALISHASVEKTYLNWQAAAELRGSTTDSFEFGGILWVKYRGAANGAQMIPATECRIVPRGVPDLLIGRFGPADYEETVNTKGLPMYARSEPKKFGKGYDLEMQTNLVHICTRPEAIIKGTI